MAGEVEACDLPLLAQPLLQGELRYVGQRHLRAVPGPPRQTAWFKLHHPKEYMAALLTSVLYWSEKVSVYIGECRDMGITLLPPDVNRSRDTFTVEEEGIRFGLWRKASCSRATSLAFFLLMARRIISACPRE